MKPIAVALLICLQLGGCAATGRPLSSTARAGRAVALQTCSRCHAVAAQGVSPNPHAPPFRDIAQRYDDRLLATEFDAIGRMGHYEMQPLVISAPDRRALAAYIGGFREDAASR